MTDFYSDPYAPPENRRVTVARELARLHTTSPDPAESKRRKQESKERLRKHDSRWKLDGWGSGLKHVSAGDPDGDSDVS